MCGRFSLAAQPELLARQFGLDEVPDYAPRFNVAPTQPVLVVGRRPERDRRSAVLMRWGLIPYWAKDPKLGGRHINARAETVTTNRVFADSFRLRRCLIPADGFFEWRTEEGLRQPYHVAFTDGRLFAFAGLWDRWRGQGADSLRSCAVITTDASDAVRPVHDRMPAILPPEAYADWLDPATPPGALLSSLAPWGEPALRLVPVTPRMNRPDYDEPENVVPIGPPLPEALAP